MFRKYKLPIIKKLRLMTTKKIITLLFIAVTLVNRAQMNIGSNAAPNADAMLEISGSTKGLLLPRVALASTSSASPLSAHVAGMSVYNTATAGAGATAVTPGCYYNTGTAWVRMAAASGSGSSWLSGGNLNGSVSTIGTNDNYDLPFVTNNNEKMRVTNAGNVGIGTNAPAAKLDIAAGISTVNTVVNATGSINDYLQFNVQNTSNGINAQSGYAATADNGNNTTGFAWLGINNSTFNYPTTYNIGVANDVSVLGSGQDLYIANAHNTKSIIFSTGKATTPFFNERMRITNGGYVGIGTSSPAYPLDVQNSLATAITGYGYLNGSGNTGYIAGSSGTVNYSARFSGRVICPEFNAQSDARIKKIKGVSRSENDLLTLNEIKITDYEMKDSVQWGNKKFKKVIAQEVEKVYAQAVSTSVGFIPDIYQQTNEVEKTDAGYTLSFCESLCINSHAKKIRVITAAGNFDMDVIAMPDNKTLVLKGDNLNLKQGEKVFAYGEEVADFRAVDYEALSTLNISATQELSKQINLLKKENSELKIKIEQLYQANCFLKEENNERLENLEASLKSLSVGLTGKVD
jgi:hypothetical protein